VNAVSICWNNNSIIHSYNFSMSVPSSEAGMTRVLVIGGTGLLGQELVHRLITAGHVVRATSRHLHSAGEQDAVEWVRIDLGTGAGLSEALAGMEAVIDTAHNPVRRCVNVGGVERLLDAAQRAGIGHLLYPSIVGINRLPLGYYKQKLTAEQRITGGTVAWTILRATQFHGFIDRTLRMAARLPLMPLPTDATFQPVDAGEVAQVLADQITVGPGGRLPDFVGPQILRLGEMVRIWMDVRQMVRPAVRVPVPGTLGRALRQGYLTEPGARHGTITWAEWLSQRYAGTRNLTGSNEPHRTTRTPDETR
jgi:uncharacterized protein YbjT (DUF2867 family)